MSSNNEKTAEVAVEKVENNDNKSPEKIEKAVKRPTTDDKVNPDNKKLKKDSPAENGEDDGGEEDEDVEDEEEEEEDEEDLGGEEEEEEDGEGEGEGEEEDDDA